MGIDWYYERQHNGILPQEIDFKTYLRHTTLLEVVVLWEALHRLTQIPYDPPENFSEKLTEMKKQVNKAYQRKFRAWQDEEHEFYPSETFTDLCGRCGKDKDNKRHF